jgi:signal transduction histidine kinase
VLTNLIDNAIKFTPKGGVITLSARNSNSHVIFEVRDTGSGISQEDLPKLFQRFFQSATGRKQYTGTGLGLYLCQQITRAHGGEIRCESQPGVGTTFIFSLVAYNNQQ